MFSLVHLKLTHLRVFLRSVHRLSAQRLPAPSQGAELLRRLDSRTQKFLEKHDHSTTGGLTKASTISYKKGASEAAPPAATHKGGPIPKATPKAAAAAAAPAIPRAFGSPKTLHKAS